MKRFISMLLALSMLLSVACADDTSSGDLLDALSGWFDQVTEGASDWASDAMNEASGWASQTWEEASDWASDTVDSASEWVSQAWDKASSWMEDNWGSASEWVEKSWNESSAWATEIWGDVSTWAKDTYGSASDSVSSWWTETFNSLTDSASDSWTWITDESETLKNEFKEEVDAVKKAVSETTDTAEATVKETYTELLSRLGLTEDDIEKVWDSIVAYAKEKGLDDLTVAKAALPNLLKLVVDSAKETASISAISIAQLFTAVLDKTGIDTDEKADELVNQLTEALNSI